MSDENYQVTSDGFYEWKIEDWNALNKEELSMIFSFKKYTFGRYLW